jgi:hypothetical protein
MKSEYRVRQLSAADITRAFPLIQAAYSGLSARDWIRFAELQVRGSQTRPNRTGIVGVENADGYINGLFTYTIVEDGLAGRALICDHFVVLELLPVGRPFAVLIEAAQDLGRDAGCDQVQLCIPSRWTAPDAVRSPVVRLLDEAGFDCQSLRFQRADPGDDAAILNLESLR